jgi:hypothetical protein
VSLLLACAREVAPCSGIFIFETYRRFREILRNAIQNP